MKYVGLFLIFVSCTAGGMTIAGCFTRSLSLCEGMLQFIRHIRSQVSFYKTPVGEMCTSFQNEAFRQNHMDALIAEKGLVAALQEREGTLLLEEDIYQALLSFANRLGRLSYEEQIADCDCMIQAMEDAIAKKRELIPAKRQIYSSLGMLSGAMVVLILL